MDAQRLVSTGLIMYFIEEPTRPLCGVGWQWLLDEPREQVDRRPEKSDCGGRYERRFFLLPLRHGTWLTHFYHLLPQ